MEEVEACFGSVESPHGYVEVAAAAVTATDAAAPAVVVVAVRLLFEGFPLSEKEGLADVEE